MKQYGVVNGIEGCGKIKKAETGNLLMGDGIGEMIVDRKESGFGGMMFCVGRLIGIKRGVRHEMFSKTYFGSTLSYFGDDREIGDRTVIRESFFIE